MKHLTSLLSESSPTAEKWFLAPSHRTGQQWVDQLVRHHHLCLNLRPTTLRSLALATVEGELASSGRRLLSQAEAAMAVTLAAGETLGTGSGYLGELEVTPGLCRALLRAVTECRRAGLTSADLKADCFVDPTKAKEFRTVLAAYEGFLATRRRVDDAEVFALAAKALRPDEGPLAAAEAIFVPTRLRTHGLESRFLEALRRACGSRIREFDAIVDQAPDETAAPSVPEFFHAVGERNEVRGVFRRIAAKGLSLDEVELVHTDSTTYVPLVYEALKVLADEAPEDAKPGATFAGGIPSSLTHPGRALAAWAAWCRDGFAQRALVSMVRDGLIDFGDTGLGSRRAAKLLRPLAILRGRERYEPALTAKMDETRLQIEAAEADRSVDEEKRQERVERARKTLADLEALARVLTPLMAATPETDDPAQVLVAARAFLDDHVRVVDEADGHAQKALVRALDEVSGLLGAADGSLGFRPYEWLETLPSTLTVLSSGPRHGCLHVAPLASGGHTGRPHVFVLGLDADRLPGGATQDPILLDAERRLLSPNLLTSEQAMDERIEDFEALMARVDDIPSLAFASSGVEDGREKSPSSLLVDLWRRRCGEPHQGPSDFLEFLGPPEAFSPTRPEYALTGGTWRLSRLASLPNHPDARLLVPGHLHRGDEALSARRSEDPTPFDGFIGPVDPRHDPTSPTGPVVSGSGLETMSDCPRRYFFRYVLGVKPPDECLIEPGRWLDAATKGSLLHALFRRFVEEHVQGRPTVDPASAGRIIVSMLDEAVAEHRRMIPPPDERVFQETLAELRVAAHLFLVHELPYWDDHEPCHCEVSLGMPPEGKTTPFDSADPVTLECGGVTLRTRGRLDRVDRRRGSSPPAYGILDYKTGSAWKFTQHPPFHQGRVLQPLVYLHMLRARLREVEPEGTVAGFSFFFPSPKEQGLRLAHEAATLERGTNALGHLARAIAEGAFPPTDDTHSCRFCDYGPVCPDAKDAAAKTKFLLRSPDGPLAHLKEVRSL